MRYVSFAVDGQASWGVLRDEGIVDLGAVMPDLRSFIAEGCPNAAELAARPVNHLLADVELSPVIPNPSKIVMAAVNYFKADDDRTKAPDYPVLFLRLAESQIGHEAPLVLPRCSSKLDFEGELAVVIGQGGRHITREEAMDHVFGYAIYNDGSVRDWQKHSHQFTPGKNFSGTGAFGPWLVTPDEMPAAPLTLVTRVNGVEKQRADTSQMIFDIPYLINYISTFTRLVPGDVIVTGTCTGFGSSRRPQEFLAPGDVVEVEIDGLGVLRNEVRAEEDAAFFN
ncbi:fumarylacetoacetate hydrolase family protein [Frigidibacter sp. ROC022]|uniref:fumarylacetoacetate hydrolase family protein n=1 Tax=Frigidibacter sp. ROC022 TaxID=2971796 RepID=UPI00215A7778|nr:fumarylacetoacetate hydrolase family protein [Frigidibacter sp. ROC022]MCR8724649.1 fumarylacetoacetate hydrolase family protein [Frigidibacter sp. ROC022]